VQIFVVEGCWDVLVGKLAAHVVVREDRSTVTVVGKQEQGSWVSLRQFDERLQLLYSLDELASALLDGI